MRRPPQTPHPPDAATRRTAKPVKVYALDRLPPFDAAFYEGARKGAAKVGETIVPPRRARAFDVPAGHFFRIECVEGPQVGDPRLWSALPYLRPMATVTRDTLDWYGFDADGAGVHDVIGTRCDPYTNRLLGGGDYHHCCHSNLARALAERQGLSFEEAERHVHDVLNVFMCTGFTREERRYFMKASPVRPGDFIEFFAEIDLIGALSACPGGDCGSGHSSEEARCFPLKVEIYRPSADALVGWRPAAVSGYRDPGA